jgi:hypothetical protein
MRRASTRVQMSALELPNQGGALRRDARGAKRANLLNWPINQPADFFTFPNGLYSHIETTFAGIIFIPRAHAAVSHQINKRRTDTFGETRLLRGPLNTSRVGPIFSPLSLSQRRLKNLYLFSVLPHARALQRRKLYRVSWIRAARL